MSMGHLGPAPPASPDIPTPDLHPTHAPPRESVAINSSLMTLARCLEVLRYNQMHTSDQKVIPYRESKVG